jgi:choline-sulfatase
MPNFLILMSDEHNPAVSSVYGHPIVQTPNMERLARLGTVYESAYCPSPLCAPSRAAFTTGRPPHEIGVINNCNVIDIEQPTYGGVLRDQGVYTVYAGKTDAGMHSSAMGFSELLAAGDRNPPGDITSLLDPSATARDAARRANGFGIRPDPFRKDTTVIDEAVAWITGTAPVLDQPWTMTVNISAPHFPHVVTEDLWEKYADGGDLPAIGPEAASANHPYAQDLRRYFGTDSFTEEQIRGLRRGYLGCVDYVDQQLGRLLESLDTSGLTDDTVVVYTSDHGEMLGTFGMWWKCSMYEDSVRVPLIVAGPGFERGARVRTPVSLFDLQASLFHATGRERPAAWWGEPLQTLQPGDADRAVFAEYHGHGTRSGSFMIRKGPWKLIHHLAAPHQLFNLEQDPRELENRYGLEPGVAACLEKELAAICSPEEQGRRLEELRDRQRAALGVVS